MEFSKTDLTIIIAMTLAIIMMSFTFSATGLVGEKKANESDIPEFQESNESYDFAGEFPGEPREISSGEVNLSEYTSAWTVAGPRESELQGVNASGDTWNLSLQIGTSVYGVEQVNPGDDYYLWNTTETVSARGTYDGDENVITYSFIEEENYGGIVGALRQFVDILFWGFGTIITIFTNAFANMFEVVVFLFDLLNWQIDTYTAIANSASSWASIMVLVPGIILMAEFAKIATLVVQVLWVG